MIYVTKLFNCTPLKHWPFDQAAWLFGDNEKELINFAWKYLNLTPRFYIWDGKPPHYLLTAGRRWQAIRNGATEKSLATEGTEDTEKGII
jgi:hypothetical protein